jgi:hypothetical protein
MTIARVGVGAMAVSITASGNLTADYPAGYSAIDGHVALVWLSGRPTGTSEPATPAGYTKRNTFLREIGANDLRGSLYYRRLVAGDAAPVFQLPATEWDGTSAGMSVTMVVYSGVDPASPFDVADATLDSAASLTFTPPAVTTVSDKAWVLAFVSTSDDNNLNLQSGSEQGFTQVFGGTSYMTTTGGDHSTGMADLEITPAGTPTMPVFEQTVGTDSWVAITVALRAEPAPSPVLFAVRGMR